MKNPIELPGIFCAIALGITACHGELASSPASGEQFATGGPGAREPGRQPPQPGGADRGAPEANGKELPPPSPTLSAIVA